MDGGLVHASEEGTPQGSPLSPLLSNVMLDDLDWELERRGHNFVRYADDGRIYVHSRRAGQRVMASITHYVEERLKLRVNRQKSVVARPRRRPFLGFRLRPRDGRGPGAGRSQSPQNGPRTACASSPRGSWGVSMERRIKEINRFTVGWTAYFALADTPTPFEDLDEWLRTPPAAGPLEGMEAPPNADGATCERSVSPNTNARQWASSRKGYWRVAGSDPLPRDAQRLLDRTGLQGIHRPLPPFPGC